MKLRTNLKIAAAITTMAFVQVSVTHAVAPSILDRGPPSLEDMTVPPDATEPPPVVAPADAAPEAALAKIGLPVPTGNHYDCYAAAQLAPQYQPKRVGLVDQFGRRHAAVLKVTRLCAPAVKYHNGTVSQPPQPKLHLVCYQVETPGPGPGPQPQPPLVLIRNQFGHAKLKVDKPARELCVPSSKIKLQ